MNHSVTIRELRSHEYEQWLVLRRKLWTDMTEDDLRGEQEAIFGNSARNRVFVAVDHTGAFMGFVEASIRDWAEGCSTHPVGYVEAWYVDPAFRKLGVGRDLIRAAEMWAKDRGCTEIGSDAELTNKLSHLAHAAVGFTEVVRVVMFSKKIPLGNVPQ